MRKTSGLALLFLIGCASTDHVHDPGTFTSNACHLHFREGEEQGTDVQLDHVSDLFADGCFNEVIQFATFIRAQRRDKFYSVSGELAEILTPEGSFTPYTLESYERSYLSVLISLSYLNLHQSEEALVELRRAIAEENAILYNYGEDPVIALLLAALWDRFDPGLARPHWQRLALLHNQDPVVVAFAKRRLHEIDQATNSRVAWRIFGLGRMPELDWHSQFFNAHPYKISPVSSFPFSCASANSIVLSTQTWTRKIATKYDSSYHPLLYAKSLARLPVGLGYGLIGISTGAALGVGGCVLASEAKQGSGEICAASIKAAGIVIGQSANLVEFTLRPDMRRWKKLPIAIVVTREEDQAVGKSCAASTAYSGFSQPLLN